MSKYHFYKVTNAICQIDYPKNYGYVLFAQYPKYTLVKLFLKDLPEGEHGFHIHEFADRRNGCISLGAHYNPYNGTHLDLNEHGNHLGDLGNITVDDDGKCEKIIKVNNLPLSGPYQIIGRSLVIHEKIDDLGRGGNEESKKTGNSGSRIACGIVGYVSSAK